MDNLSVGSIVAMSLARSGIQIRYSLDPVEIEAAVVVRGGLDRTGRNRRRGCEGGRRRARMLVEWDVIFFERRSFAFGTHCGDASG